jgi:hypothetical protein
MKKVKFFERKFFFALKEIKNEKKMRANKKRPLNGL